MIKFYLSTVLIYFTIYMTSGLLMRKQFIKARDKLRKSMNDNSKIYGYVRTAINYLLLSLIPLLRLLFLVGKFYFMFNTDDYIKKIKEYQMKRINKVKFTNKLLKKYKSDNDKITSLCEKADKNKKIQKLYKKYLKKLGDDK